jgi:hypothetical protein
VGYVSFGAALVLSLALGDNRPHPLAAGAIVGFAAWLAVATLGIFELAARSDPAAREFDTGHPEGSKQAPRGTTTAGALAVAGALLALGTALRSVAVCTVGAGLAVATAAALLVQFHRVMRAPR